MKGLFTEQALPVSAAHSTEGAPLARNLIADSPAFGAYLAALALLPFRWLSPAGSLQQHADWTDILVALAAALWLFERLRARTLVRSLRIWQLPLALYLGLAAVSYVFAVPGRGASASTVVLMVELAVLATITADFAADVHRRRAIARAIVASAAATVALGALALILFYAGVHTGLIGAYGRLTPSHLYARVQAGFEAPQLLANFCIFASGVVASDDAALSRRLRITLQVALCLLCAATLSRGLIGFFLAAVIRYSTKLKGRRRRLVPVAAAFISLAIIAALSIGRVHVEPANLTKSYYVFPDPGGRREAFVTSLKTLEHHPVVGIGPGAPPGVNDLGPIRAHFTPLNVAATLGLPALGALIITVALVWRRRRHPMDIALWSAAAGILLDGLGQDIDHFRDVWVLLGLLGS